MRSPFVGRSVPMTERHSLHLGLVFGWLIALGLGWVFPFVNLNLEKREQVMVPFKTPCSVQACTLVFSQLSMKTLQVCV